LPLPRRKSIKISGGANIIYINVSGGGIPRGIRSYKITKGGGLDGNFGAKPPQPNQNHVPILCI